MLQPAGLGREPALTAGPAVEGPLAGRWVAVKDNIATLGLPQVKLGWIVAGGPLAQRHDALKRLELIADTYLSVGTPVQVAAPALLAQGAANIASPLFGGLPATGAIASRSTKPPAAPYRDMSKLWEPESLAGRIGGCAV